MKGLRINTRLLSITPLLCVLASAPVVVAQTKSSNAATTTGSDARPIEELQAAAQRLREAIQAMAKAPAGPQRTDAMKAANRALTETQSAMVDLPPELLTAGACESDYQKAMDRLQQAAQSCVMRRMR